MMAILYEYEVKDFYSIKEMVEWLNNEPDQVVPVTIFRGSLKWNLLYKK